MDWVSVAELAVPGLISLGGVLAGVLLGGHVARRGASGQHLAELQVDAFVSLVASVTKTAQLQALLALEDTSTKSLEGVRVDLADTRASYAASKARLAAFGDVSVVQSLAKIVLHDDNFSDPNVQSSMVDIVDAIRAKTHPATKVPRDQVIRVLFGESTM